MRGAASVSLGFTECSCNERQIKRERANCLYRGSKKETQKREKERVCMRARVLGWNYTTDRRHRNPEGKKRNNYWEATRSVYSQHFCASCVWWKKKRVSHRHDHMMEREKERNTKKKNIYSSSLTPFFWDETQPTLRGRRASKFFPTKITNYFFF